MAVTSGSGGFWNFPPKWGDITAKFPVFQKCRYIDSFPEKWTSLSQPRCVSLCLIHESWVSELFWTFWHFKLESYSSHEPCSLTCPSVGLISFSARIERPLIAQNASSNIKRHSQQSGWMAKIPRVRDLVKNWGSWRINWESQIFTKFVLSDVLIPELTPNIITFYLTFYLCLGMLRNTFVKIFSALAQREENLHERVKAQWENLRETVSAGRKLSRNSSAGKKTFGKLPLQREIQLERMWGGGVRALIWGLKSPLCTFADF